MSNEDFFDEELATVLLMDEEGNEHLFELLAELEIEGDSYKVLAPMDVEEYPDEDDDFEVEIVILKAINDEEGNEFLCSIEEDEEWERVADAWQEFMEEERYFRRVNPRFFIRVRKIMVEGEEGIGT